MRTSHCRHQSLFQTRLMLKHKIVESVSYVIYLDFKMFLDVETFG